MLVKLLYFWKQNRGYRRGWGNRLCAYVPAVSWNPSQSCLDPHSHVFLGTLLRSTVSSFPFFHSKIIISQLFALKTPGLPSPLIQLLTGGISSHIASNPRWFQLPASPSPETPTHSVPCTHSPHTWAWTSKHSHFFRTPLPESSRYLLLCASSSCCSLRPQLLLLPMLWA